jgi:hypothetical protein
MTVQRIGIRSLVLLSAFSGPNQTEGAITLLDFANQAPHQENEEFAIM